VFVHASVTLGKCYRCDVGRFKKKDLQDHFARAAAECAELLYVRSCWMCGVINYAEVRLHAHTHKNMWQSEQFTCTKKGT
jgi:hypothetical protein